jgi:hypothetical protein
MGSDDPLALQSKLRLVSAVVDCVAAAAKVEPMAGASND